MQVAEFEQTITAYHGTVRNVDKFFPFSHFGSWDAAVARLTSLSGMIISRDNNHRIQICPQAAHIYKVSLTFKKLLKITDDKQVQHSAGKFLDHLAAQHPNSAIVQNVENWEPVILDENRKSIVAPSIEIDKLRIELTKLGFYSRNYIEQQDDISLAMLAFDHRIIGAIQTHGYDGFKYVNRAEDRGSLAFVNLHHSQVVITQTFDYGDIINYLSSNDCQQKSPTPKLQPL